MPDSIKRKVPTYRLHKASGRAVVTIPTRGIGRGRDVFLGQYGTQESRQRYQRTIQEWLLTGDVRPEAAADITIMELVDRFWHEYVVTYYVAEGNLSLWFALHTQFRKVVEMP